VSTRVHSRRIAISSAAAALALAACGGLGDGGEALSVSLVFPTDALLSLPTDGGKLSVELWSSPQPPQRGDDAVQMRFRDKSGALVSGLTISVVPWMPAHGHGTSVKPIVTEPEPGVYVAAPVYLFMAGAWQLITTISGPVDDTVAPTLDIP